MAARAAREMVGAREAEEREAAAIKAIEERKANPMRKSHMNATIPA